MRLIVETIDGNDICITESKQEDENGKKQRYIEGIFAQAELPNRNKRIYPKPVLEPAIDIYIRDFVKQNRALGEINHPSCFINDDFSVLTPEGWKPFLEIQTGNMVCAMDTEGNLVNSRVQNITNETVTDADYYHLTGTGIDSTVTANHRFFLIDGEGKHVVKTAEEIHNMESRDGYRIIKSMNGREKKETFVVPGIPHDETKKRRNAFTESLILNVADFARFFGLWLNYGKLTEKKVVLNIKNPDVLYEAIELMSRLPFMFVRKGTRISFSDKRITELLRNVHDGVFSDVLKEMLCSGLNDFAEGYAKKEVRKSKEMKKLSARTFFTQNEKISDLVQECLVLSGQSAKVQKFDTKKGVVFAVLPEMIHGIPLASEFGFQIEKKVLDGKACCLTTEHGNFVVRDNGFIFLTGNSPTVDPAKACIMIESLTWHGNDVHGKAKVLSTPAGQLLDNLISDGVHLGVSTRGLGSVTKTTKDGQTLSLVENDYSIKAIDVVHAPSGIDCFVDGILEGVEFYYENNVLTERKIEEYVEHVRKNDVEAIKSDFRDFLNRCRSRMF